MNKVNESVWNDIRRRGIGTDEKQEEQFDRDGLFEYIFEHYDCKFKDDSLYTIPFKSGEWPLTKKEDKTNEWFQIPIFSIKEYGTKYSFIVKFENNKIVKIALDANEEKCSEFMDILKENFEVTISESGSPILITGKEGILTTKICLSILDTIIENVKYPCTKKKEN